MNESRMRQALHVLDTDTISFDLPDQTHRKYWHVNVMAVKSKINLGIIIYESRWDCYVFLPSEYKFEMVALLAIADALKLLNKNPSKIAPTELGGL